MKVRDSSLELERIEPTAIAGYLTDRGWRRRGKGFPGVETWARGRAGTKGSISILLPTDRSLADFNSLLERAIAEIAQFEGRPAQDLIVDVVAPSSGVLRVGVEVEADPAGGISLNVASDLLDTLVRATSAAAEEAARASNAPGAWQANAVRSYLDRVRFEHTEPGSYVMKALLPDRLSENEDPAATPSVTRTLMEDLKRLSTVTVDSKAEASGFAHLWNWPFGLDVIHALAQLSEPSIAAAFIEIELPPQAEKTRPPAWDFRFEREDLARFETLGLPSRIAVARQEVRAQPSGMRPEEQVLENVVLEGEVVRLSRPEITLETFVDGERLRVRVPRVAPDLYAVAYEAHGRQMTVRAVGTLVIRGTQASLRNLVALELVTKDE